MSPLQKFIKDCHKTQFRLGSSFDKDFATYMISFNQSWNISIIRENLIMQMLIIMEDHWLSWSDLPIEVEKVISNQFSY